VVCVAYDPEWEPLANALIRVMASGVNEQQAKADICNAVADRQIVARVVIDKSHLLDGGRTFSGGNVGIPPRLNATDFDWAQSRPLKPWSIGPMHGQHYTWLGGWQDRPISLIELSTADVRDVLCNAGIPTNTRNAGRKPTKLEQTKTAMRDDIKSKKLTPGQLKEMLQKNLAERYNVSRETACKAREEVLSEINSPH
jgi:hypothetical protein